MKHRGSDRIGLFSGIIARIQHSPERCAKWLKAAERLRIPILRRLVSRINGKKDSSVPPVIGYAAFQNCGGKADMLRFGLSRMKKNGCAVMAAYNALLALGISADIRDVARHMEADGAILLGIFGANPRFFPAFFTGFDLHPTYLYGIGFSEYDAALPPGGLGLLTFWNIPGKLSAHTVMVKRTRSGTVQAYNMGKKSEYAEFSSLSELFTISGVIPLAMTVVPSDSR